MTGEIRLFLAAVQFLTRLPVGFTGSLSDDWLFRSAKYFPAVGLLVGLISALVFCCASLVWGGAIPAVLAVAASVLITGALHEDGLADTIDGFGGGQTVEARLAIMKDSRLGTYGAIALIVSITIRIAVLASLPVPVAAIALIAAHSLARFAPVVALKVMAHSGDRSAAKTSYDGQPIRPVELLTGAIFAGAGFGCMAFVSVGASLLGLALGALLAVWVARKAVKLINGYTGDVLGAIEQMSEIGFLLGLFAIFS